MQNYQENLAARVQGVLQPLLGVSVLVTAANGQPAALYKDDGVTPLGNPLITDADGYFAFFAPNGRYTLTFSGAQIQTSSRTIELYDVDDVPPVTQQQLASASGAGMIGYGAQTVAQALDGKAPADSPSFTGSIRTTAAGIVTVLSADANGAYLETQGANNMRLYTNGAERVRIDSAGNFGVGTAAPQAKISAGGGTGKKILAFDAGAGSSQSGLGIDLSGSTNEVGLFAGTGDGLLGRVSFGRLNTSNGSYTQTACIDGGGNFGLGVSPSAKLDIGIASGSGTPRVRVDQTGDDPYLELQRWSGSASNFLGSRIKQRGTDLAFELQTGSSGAALVSQTFAERMRLDYTGNLLVGVTTGSGHRLYKGSGEGSNLLNVEGSLGNTFLIYGVSGFGWNSANTAVIVGKNGATSRSINAAGTVNASGADYAEYMTKADGCGVIAKGQIVGVNASGLLTDKWADAVSFLVKSTDPSYVGGDTWGSEEALQMARPVEPAFAAPAYAGAPYPGEAPAAPLTPEDEEDADFLEAQALFESASGQYLAALAQYEADQQAHAVAVAAAQQQFDTVTMPAYLAALAEFEAVLEAARLRVDRIAYCGQVPVNVLGAQPGQYVVPVQDGEGIGGQLVSKAAITLKQYMAAVGIVQNILPDGRANVRVKPV